VAAGLKTLPSSLSSAAPSPIDAASTQTMLFETVWQSLVVTAGEQSNGQQNVPVLDVDYTARDTGSGGISLTTDIPGYQRDYGLSSLTGGKRGLPDVTTLAGSNAEYTVLNAGYVNGDRDANVLTGGSGTSFASPLWAALTAQFNAIFRDQGLPSLGYYNDLLYIASVIAPGSFNDIELGNNITGFYTTAGEPGSTGYYDPRSAFGSCRPAMATGHCPATTW
jgi:subtilase family serine protease